MMKSTEASSDKAHISSPKKESKQDKQIRSPTTSPNLPWRFLSLCVFVVVMASLFSSSMHGEAAKDQLDGYRRRLTSLFGGGFPSYIDVLLEDLKKRQRLFEETPENEIKYWFEYSGPLQVSRTLTLITMNNL